MVFGVLALMVACLFTGAAFYIGFAEHPARLTLENGPLLSQWKLSYMRGFALQASLAVLGAVLGAVAFVSLGNVLWMVGGLLMLANWPFTLIFIMPTNKKLMDTEPGVADGATRALLVRWGKLHAVRSWMGLAACVVLFWAVLRG
jgi:hypothetical protein